MSYRDPYVEQYGNAQSGRHEFNPYSSQPAYPSYGQAGPHYNDYTTPYQDSPMNRGTSVNRRTKDTDETSGFDRGEFTTRENPAGIKKFRRSYQGNMWTKGGKGRGVIRFLCCTLFIGLFLLLSIVLALALWLKPPSITIGSANITSTNNFLSQTAISVPLTVNISVNNPNYFSVTLKELKAEFTYPKGNVPVGNGILNNVVFESNSAKTFAFPFNINYKFADDPSLQALFDIGEKCGVTSGQKSNLSFQYKITIGLQILVAHVKPSISNTISIPCPLGQAEIEQLKKLLGSS
ncbi:hypothetical protein E1B28_008893 [Marasmius oreades]|uniref:Late embryogenesis abundant protein LEA-2 subgroup domain-containing protein n=1 Tax=Marasmius oreades TaxID=181124 RepID=A0A9P7RZV5_9AGAR|nr:uncharacterized protein E1B28_008893 [Marasmius oreades]KAG7092543.1 hypothetical protein E1B28_008893 [Marasmius oreades]